MMLDKRLVNEVLDQVAVSYEDLSLNEDNRVFFNDKIPTVIKLLMKGEELLALEIVIDALIATTDVGSINDRNWEVYHYQHYVGVQLITEIKEIVEREYYSIDDIEPVIPAKQLDKLIDAYIEDEPKPFGAFITDDKVIETESGILIYGGFPTEEKLKPFGAFGDVPQGFGTFGGFPTK